MHIQPNLVDASSVQSDDLLTDEVLVVRTRDNDPSTFELLPKSGHCMRDGVNFEIYRNMPGEVPDERL